MKTLLVLLTALLLAGCGEDGQRTITTAPPAPPSTMPTGAAPEAPDGGPPAAWLETDSGSYWLGFSTYCWTTSCADYITPSCGAAHVPTLELKKGERVRIHLGFKPKETSLTYFDGIKPVVATKFAYPEFTVERAGVFSLFTVAAEGEEGGDASYVGCVRFVD